jgi:taurine transport system permease protein
MTELAARELSAPRRLRGLRLASLRPLIPPFLGVGFVLAIWWALTATHAVSPLFLPSPARTWDTFIQTGFEEGYQGHLIWWHLGVSLLRIGIAFGAAVIVGVTVGLMAYGVWPVIGRVIDPLINFYRPLPPLAYYTLLIVWFGIGETSKLLLLFLAGLPPIVIATAEGVRNTREVWRESAATLGASHGQVFRHIVLPAALPEIFTGLRIALAFTYTTLVAAELIAATSGIGWVVLQGSKFLQTEVIFVGVILMGLTGIALDLVIRGIDRALVPWRGKA